ncbi:MAG TPA: hypothetical protein VFR69_02990 [Rubrobacteraceae bacterium]|nr:hypothetical protein [Rubrobacteraceae bacterium]
MASEETPCLVVGDYGKGSLGSAFPGSTPHELPHGSEVLSVTDRGRAT